MESSLLSMLAFDAFAGSRVGATWINNWATSMQKIMRGLLCADVQLSEVAQSSLLNLDQLFSTGLSVLNLNHVHVQIDDSILANAIWRPPLASGEGYRSGMGPATLAGTSGREAPWRQFCPSCWCRPSTEGPSRRTGGGRSASSTADHAHIQWESILLDGLPTLTLPAQLQRKWTHAGGQHVFVEGVVASLSLHCAPCPSIKQHHQVVRLPSQSCGQGGGAVEPILCAMWVDQAVKVSF